MEEKKDLTEEQLAQSTQIKEYIENYRKAHTPWRRVDVKMSELKELGDDTPIYKEVGRNDLCTCGSGRKVKKCCGVQTRYYLQDGKPMDI